MAHTAGDTAKTKNIGGRKITSGGTTINRPNPKTVVKNGNKPR